MQEDTLSWMQLDSVQVIRLENLSREQSIIQSYALAARSLRGDTIYHRYPDLESTTSPRLASQIKPTPKKTGQKNVVRIYPNPNSGTFTLELTLEKEEQIEWKIFDLTGRQLKSGKLPGGAKQIRSSIEITDLVDGLYLVELRGEDKGVIALQRITLAR